MKKHGRENIAIVKEFYRALAGGDTGLAHMLLDPAVEWVEHAGDLYFSGRHIGRQILFDDIIDPTHDKIIEFEIKPKRFFAVGDNVVVTGHDTGRGRVTDIKLHGPMTHVWTVANKKLVRCEGFHDELEWNVALGLTSVQTETEKLAA